ncbi:MAG: hypothetical protein HC838_05040, partial [Spirulinaceae cyanobacterium RM2_2_10]|nr:hypothetical protein [Spirulinaceae cyanobacterium RM2_2_10]
MSAEAVQRFASWSESKREEPRQPRRYDAVLGGRLPAPPDSALLGGLAGVRQRLAGGEPAYQITALTEALRYGEAGIALVVAALDADIAAVQWRAYQLLRYQFEAAPDLSIPARLSRDILAVLRGYNPWALFTHERWSAVHDGPIASLAIAPDGRFLVSGSHDKTVKVWNLYTGQLLYTLAGHSDWVSAVAIAPNNRTLSSGSVDRTLVQNLGCTET